MAKNQLKAGVILNYVILGLNALIGLLYMPYMLRMLGQSEYGIYSLAASVIAYLSMLDLGFGNAVIRYTAKYRAENNPDKQYSMFGMFTILYSIIAILVLIIGGIIVSYSDNIFGNTLTPSELERTKYVILLMMFNLAITFPLSIYGAIITAYERFIFLRVIQVIRIILSTITMIGLLYYGQKAIALVVCQTIFNLVTLSINYFYCKKKIKVSIRFDSFDKKLFKEIMLYSFWIFLNIVMDKIYWSTGQFILGAMVGTIAIAIFSVAIQLQQIYMSFSTAISGVLLPKVTSMVANGDNKLEISNLFIKTGRIQFIVLSYILTAFIIFGRQFIQLWAGDGYSDSYIITLLFLISLTIPLIQNSGIVILQARNQMMFRSILYLIISAISLIAQIYLCKIYGGIGCAIAIAAALFIGQGLIINIYYHIKQKIDIPKFWREIGKMSITPTLFIIIASFCYDNQAIISLPKFISYITIFTITYIVAEWYISMNKYEQGLIKNAFAKIKHLKS